MIDGKNNYKIKRLEWEDKYKFTVASLKSNQVALFYKDIIANDWIYTE